MHMDMNQRSKLGHMMTVVHKWLYLFLLLMSPILTACGIPKVTAQPGPESYTVVDAKGTQVTLLKKPERILTGNLAYDTMVLGLVSPDHLVAVNSLDHDPMMSFISEETKGIHLAVHSSMEIPLELVLKAKPDLIITSSWMDQNTIDMLRGLGYPVVVCEGPNSIEDVRNAIILIGKALGENERGQRLVHQMDEEIGEADAVLDTLTRPRPSGLLISQMQSYGGPGSMYHDLVTHARIENSIEAVGLKNGEPLTKELILKADPDFFIVSADRKGDPVRGPKFRREFFSDPALSGMRGIQHVVSVPDRYIYCASQNAGYAIKALANSVYGPLFDLSDEHNLTVAGDDNKKSKWEETVPDGNFIRRFS